MKICGIVQVLKILENVFNAKLRLFTPNHTPTVLTIYITRLPTPWVFMPMKLVKQPFLPNEISLIKRHFVVIFITSFLNEQTPPCVPESTCDFCWSLALFAVVKLWPHRSLLCMFSMEHWVGAETIPVNLLGQMSLQLFQLWQTNSSVVGHQGWEHQCGWHRKIPAPKTGKGAVMGQVLGTLGVTTCNGLCWSVRYKEVARTPRSPGSPAGGWRRVGSHSS